MAHEKEWRETDSVEDFLTKIDAPSDTIVVVLDDDVVNVHNDSNGYIFVNLYRWYE
jgi:sulfur carrier protein ThiS|tara:strand:- start:60 stop:227 length:168 start_codon:yes stop_codon:yes gene_type:complete